MVAALCPRCRHCYVLDTQNRPGDNCPQCSEPLQSLSFEELRAHLLDRVPPSPDEQSVPEIAFRLLSPTETKVLVEAVTAAHDEGMNDQAARGYGMLLAGLCRARQRQRGDDPDGMELVQEWENALENYRDLYGGQ